MFLMLWGRLGYDPSVKDEVFDSAARAHLGVKSNWLVDAWKQASRVIPTAFTAYSLGPDHRDHAPELEWGGSTDDFIQGEPFDSHVFRSVKEGLAYAATGGIDGRWPAEELSFEIPDGFHALEEHSFAGAAQTNREVHAAVAMLGHLAAYYKARLACANHSALAEGVL